MSQTDLQSWSQKLEKGELGDPALEIAAWLQNYPSKPLHAPDNFKAELKLRLLAQNKISPVNRRTSINALSGIGLVVVFLALSILGLFDNTQTVSAAELLQRSSEAFSTQTAGADIIYDRLRLDWDWGSGANQQNNMVADLWVYPDKLALRYQIMEGQDYYYFEQHAGNQHWESYHNRPVGIDPVEYIYASTALPYAQNLQSRGLPGTDTLINGDYVNAWLKWSRLALERQQTCSDLFCLIGITDLYWECDEKQCTTVASFDDIDGNPQQSNIQAILLGTEQQENGDEWYVIEISRQGFEQYGKTTIRIDAQTYLPAEFVTEYQNPEYDTYLYQRLQILEHRGLMVDELPANFFNAPPEDLVIREWSGSNWARRKPQTRPNPEPADRVWIESLSPISETQINGLVNIELVLGYELISLPEAALEIVIWPQIHQTQPISAGAGTATFNWVINTDDLDLGEIRLEARLATYTGIYSSVDLSTHYRDRYEEPFLARWCVRCAPNTFPAIPPIQLTNPNVAPLIELVTTGQPIEGIQIASMELAQKRVVISWIDAEKLDRLPEIIYTVPFDLSTITESGQFRVDLDLPAGIKVHGDPYIYVDIVLE